MPAAGLKSYEVKCCLAGGGWRRQRWKNPPRISAADCSGTARGWGGPEQGSCLVWEPGAEAVACASQAEVLQWGWGQPGRVVQALDPGLYFCQGKPAPAPVYVLPVVGTRLGPRAVVSVEMHPAAVPSIRACPLVEVFSSPPKARGLLSAAPCLQGSQNC